MRTLGSKMPEEKIDTVTFFVVRQLAPAVQELLDTIRAWREELDPPTGDGKLDFGGIWIITGHGAVDPTLWASAPTGSLYCDKDTAVWAVKPP